MTTARLSGLFAIILGIPLGLGACSGKTGNNGAPSSAAGFTGSGGSAGGGGTAGIGGAAGTADDNSYRGCDGEDRTNNSCPIAGSICVPPFGCQPPAVNGKCPEPPAGSTAKPVGSGPCVLDCLPTMQGDPPVLACPDGMICGDNGFCVTHHASAYGTCAEQTQFDARFCPVAGSICDPSWGCSPPCPSGVGDCPAPTDGSATPECSAQKCRLSCSMGATCPTGMSCGNFNLFCIANGP